MAKGLLARTIVKRKQQFYPTFPTDGSGNVILNAANITINENGRSALAPDGVTINDTGNNWALDNNNNDGDDEVNTNIDTSHVIGKAVASQGTLTFYNANNAPINERSGFNSGSDVSRYTVDLDSLAPQNGGTFTFQRKLN